MKKILKRKDYDRIEEELNILIEDYGVKYFPMDCFEVASLMNIEIKSYSQFSQEDCDFIVSHSEDGFTIFKNKKYVIYYNEKKNDERIRFTIWHEIAHIHLGHLEKDCKISYEQMEEEANHFATHALAPLQFVHRLSLFSPLMLCTVCGVSFELANYVLAHYRNAFQYESIKKAILSNRISKLLTFEGGE